MHVHYISKCVYYSICIRTFVFQVNQIQHVKNIQLEIKSTVKMLVNNDTNMLRGAGSKYNQTYGVIDRVWLLVMSVFLWLLEWFTKRVAQTGKWKASTDLLSFMYEYIQVFKWESFYFIGYFTKSIYLFSGIYEIILYSCPAILTNNTCAEDQEVGLNIFYFSIFYIQT